MTRWSEMHPEQGRRDAATHATVDPVPIPTPEPPSVIVRTSERRHRTVSAHREKGAIVVILPARITARERADWVDRMVRRVLEREAAHRPPAEPDALWRRADLLAARYLEPDLAGIRPSEVRFVGNQRRRWGSCSPDSGVIRLSDRLQRTPPWVIDYVLIHELAHLVEPNHGPRFSELIQRFPDHQRGQGFLLGYETASNVGDVELEHGFGVDDCDAGADCDRPRRPEQG